MQLFIGPTSTLSLPFLKDRQQNRIGLGVRSFASHSRTECSPAPISLHAPVYICFSRLKVYLGVSSSVLTLRLTNSDHVLTAPNDPWTTRGPHYSGLCPHNSSGVFFFFGTPTQNGRHIHTTTRSSMLDERLIRLPVEHNFRRVPVREIATASSPLHVSNYTYPRGGEEKAEDWAQKYLRSRG